MIFREYSTSVSECGLGGYGVGANARAGDTKAGALIGTDKYGNKYFENLGEELPRQ